MGHRRGEIEKWLRRIKWGGNSGNYVVYIRHRIVDGSEILRSIRGDEIDDVRRGYIFVGDEQIPLHRVEEIRDIEGNVLYKRRSRKPL
ncbi:MAG: DUF504 domain-containing protein [Desulfurococcales archaeon]|nr:DUF504 domain-containing protein [Desulfurococcales archaeon]